MPAHAALAAATLHGARALGLEASIGSLAPGKFADLCAIDMDQPELLPCYDPVSHLVYSAGREHVSHVWVAGEPRVKEGKLLQIENLDLNRRILPWHNKLAAEA
jgi:5-methylthioadenosine/S-adenosylhomocysteine deaminase